MLGLVLGLPSGITAVFDGLPWIGEAETLSLAVIIPCLLILGRQFLSLRFSIVFLCALFLLKTILFVGSPSSGWLVKVHPNLTQKQFKGYYPFQLVAGDSWVRTYATMWNKEASGILKNPWTEKLDFPLDWILLKPKCGASGARCFDEVNPILEIDGILVIPEGKKFSLMAEGVQEGNLLATNEEGKSLNLIPAKNRQEATQQDYQFLQSGKWTISGRLNYKGKNWSLIPVLVDVDGKINPDLGRGVLWHNSEEISGTLEHIGIYKVLSFILDGGVILFLFAWLAWTVQLLANKQILSLPLALSSIAAVFIPIIMAPVYAGILDKLHSPDLTTISYLGFSILVTGVGFLFWSYWKKDFRSFQVDRLIPSIFLLFGPAMLFFFVNKWWSIIGQWKIWGSGNDWTTYQSFARKIIVEGDWLGAGEGVFTMMPLYRYIVGIYHLLFGQSAFVQHMADVWCVLGATIIIVAFAMKFRISPLLVFIASITYLSINLISAFRYHIGKGLVENHAMIFIMLAAWLLYRAREGGAMRLTLATLFGILGYWTRQDHLGVVAGLAFLVLEPVEGPTGGWKGYWGRFQLQWRNFVIYWGLGISSVLAVCFRNWWLGGAFYPSDKNAAIYAISAQGSPLTSSVYTILAANAWPNPPSIMLSIVLTSGTILALIALMWRPKSLIDFPISLGIIIIGLFGPYAFLWFGGYPPRFSIHLLPLAVISLICFLNYFTKRYEFPIKYHLKSN